MDTSTILIIALIAIVALVLVVLISRRRSDNALKTSAPSRLSRSASALGSALKGAWRGGLDDNTWDEIEEALIAADVGPAASGDVVAGVKGFRPQSVDEARSELAKQLRAQLMDLDRGLVLAGTPSVIVVVGVNGTGKTTTIAKLANRLGGQGRSVVLGAADTFRAAAGAQLEAWGGRLQIPVVGGQEGGDPASVAHDTLSSARARGADVAIIDTAGRLHGKKNLMSELSKIHRVSAGDRGEVDEVLLVLDATAGQNGLSQVSVFSEAVPLTGIVLTKLDGTAKGGIVIAVERELGVPVKFVGIGEGMDDLEPFDPDRFISELLEQS